MRRSGIKLLASLLLVLSTSAGSAIAQDSGVSGDLERTATASPQEKLQYAADAVDELKATVKAAQKLMADAQGEGATDKVDCLSAKLSQLESLAQVTEAADSSMKQALESGNQERASHEMRKIAVALSKSRQLSLESQACVDDSGVAVGKTVLSAEGGIEGEEDETESLDVDVMDQGFDPPQASPFN
ncbi:MAG: hypothetical protein AB8H79_15315 [Myxococcota bacterium]